MGPEEVLGARGRSHLRWLAARAGGEAGYQHFCLEPWVSMVVTATCSYPSIFDNFHGVLVLNVNKKKVLQMICKNKLNSMGLLV